jgi:hypothetical protein
MECKVAARPSPIFPAPSLLRGKMAEQGAAWWGTFVPSSLFRLMLTVRLGIRYSQGSRLHLSDAARCVTMWLPTCSCRGRLHSPNLEPFAPQGRLLQQASVKSGNRRHRKGEKRDAAKVGPMPSLRLNSSKRLTAGLWGREQPVQGRAHLRD